MKKDEYFRVASELYDSGKIDGEVYDAMVMNADEFCEDSDEDCNLPSTYAEIEYDDFDSLEAMVKKFEKEHECVVYHVILSRTNIGTMYSLLYVSLDDEEWEEDRADLQNGQVLAYVVNKTDPECSEIGYIGIKPQIGGLVRVA